MPVLWFGQTQGLLKVGLIPESMLVAVMAKTKRKPTGLLRSTDVRNKANKDCNEKYFLKSGRFVAAPNVRKITSAKGREIKKGKFSVS